MTTPAATADVRLSSPQVRALKALAEVHPDGLTVEEIKTRSRGAINNVKEIGPGRPGIKLVPTSLYGRKLVRAEWHDVLGFDAAVYFITESGLEVAGRYRARKRGKYNTVPNAELDRAVLQVRPTRAYGFEQYDEGDMRAVLALLPPQYHSIPLGVLRDQAITRRKAGAYSGPVEWPAWYVEYRKTEHFQAVEKSCHVRGCDINNDHDEGIGAYHRTLVSLGDEEPEDMVTLCAACYRRNRKALPKLPTKSPL